jgi:hypothetical protein
MRRGGTVVSWQGSIPEQKLIKLERRWDSLSLIGLACVIIGILLHGAAVWISSQGKQKTWQNLATGAIAVRFKNTYKQSADVSAVSKKNSLA